MWREPERPIKTRTLDAILGMTLTRASRLASLTTERLSI
jgi:hypothetical protein